MGIFPGSVEPGSPVYRRGEQEKNCYLKGGKTGTLGEQESRATVKETTMTSWMALRDLA